MRLNTSRGVPVPVAPTYYRVRVYTSSGTGRDRYPLITRSWLTLKCIATGSTRRHARLAGSVVEVGVVRWTRAPARSATVQGDGHRCSRHCCLSRLSHVRRTRWHAKLPSSVALYLSRGDRHRLRLPGASAPDARPQPYTHMHLAHGPQRRGSTSGDGTGGISSRSPTAGTAWYTITCTEISGVATGTGTHRSRHTRPSASTPCRQLLMRVPAGSSVATRRWRPLATHSAATTPDNRAAARGRNGGAEPSYSKPRALAACVGRGGHRTGRDSPRARGCAALRSDNPARRRPAPPRRRDGGDRLGSVRAPLTGWRDSRTATWWWTRCAAGAVASASRRSRRRANEASHTLFHRAAVRSAPRPRPIRARGARLGAQQ